MRARITVVSGSGVARRRAPVPERRHARRPVTSRQQGRNVRLTGRVRCAAGRVKPPVGAPVQRGCESHGAALAGSMDRALPAGFEIWGIETCLWKLRPA